MARSAPGEVAAAPSNRLISLDAYRGFIMLAMASSGLALVQVADRNPHWRTLANQSDHREWFGCSFWDLIQPSFMFIVGVSMVMSYAARTGQGQSWARQCVHAFKRAALLCFIGMFLDWYGSGELYVQFIRVLQQIAIGYLIAFVFLPLGPKVQSVAAVFLLVGHTAAFVAFGNMNGSDPWLKQMNFGLRLDELLHLQLSRNRDYVTFNAISSAATILFGVLIGELLRSPASLGKKLGMLIGVGVACLVVGFVLSGGDARIVQLANAEDAATRPIWVVPMIKKLWTASFAIFAAGWTCLMLAGFFAIVECLGFKMWTFPFLVVGMNSIAMYVIYQMFRFNAKQIANLIVPPIPSQRWSQDDVAREMAKRRLCDVVPVVDFSTWHVTWGVDLRNWYLTPLVESSLILLIFWLACFWLYRRKIFFKV